MASKEQDLHIYPASFFKGRPEVSGITVDNKDTRDMDDGIMIWPLDNGGYRIQVSIADTSTAIRPGSGVDERAYEQAFTLYRPGRNKTMLPVKLDRDMLSLVEGPLRPAVTVEMMLDADLNLTDRKIFRSAFKNIRKSTYEEVHQQVGEGQEQLKQWSDLSLRLLNKRRQEGALAFYDMSQGLVLDEDGNLQRLERDSHKGYILIQEMMILTNRAVAEFMDENNIPTLFRNHAADATLDGMGSNIVHGIQEAIEGENPEALADIQKRLRFWFQRARYEPEKKGHFGLQVPAYLHFTSPIRRYADLVVHRNLTDFLEGRDPTYSHEKLAEIGKHLNARTDAEKDHEKTKVYKDFKRTRLSGFLASNQTAASYMGKPEHEIRTMLKVANEDGIENDGLKQDVLKRLQGEDVNLRIVSRLIVENDSESPYWTELRSAALDHLRAFPEIAISLLDHAARDYEDWQGYTYQSQTVAGGFAEIPRVTITGETISAPLIPAASNKKAAKTLAAIAFWQAFADKKLTNIQHVTVSDKIEAGIQEEVDMPEASATLYGGNPIGILNEAAQKGRFEIGFTDKQTGPSHRPSFTVTATLSGGQFAEPVSFSGTGVTKKDAKANAAIEAIGYLGIEQKKEINAPEAVSVDTSQNPVSAINEFRQKRGWPDATSEFSKRGPDHQPQFHCVMTLKDGSGTHEFIGAGTDANKKQAKQKAAGALLLKVQEAFPTGFAFNNAGQGVSAGGNTVVSSEPAPRGERPRDPSDGVS